MHVIEIAGPLPLALPRTHPMHEDALSKRRKIERACDACRRRKTRCDGPRMPDNVCTNCAQNRKSCSYLEASKPRGPPKAYITSLEDRLEGMEALLKRLRPEADFSEELGPPVVRDSWKSDPEPPCRMFPHEKSTSSSKPNRFLPPGALPVNPAPRVRRSTGTPRSDTDLSSDDHTSSDSDEIGELSLSRGMKRLTVRGLEPTQDRCSLADNQVRFHGKSSFFKLIEPTRKLRDQHVNRVTGGEERSRPSRDGSSPANVAPLRRPQYWTAPSWELAFEGFQGRPQDPSMSFADAFPPQDLADSLIELYFENPNSFVPLFHRPTFERQWREGLQLEDTWFGCLCLALFAVASRWSDDPRVLGDGKYDVPRAKRLSEEQNWQRAGWRYFNAAIDIHRGSLSLFHPPGLFEVQTTTLLVMFLRGTAFNPIAWLFISVGLRKAQDVGAHRKKIYGDKPSIEGELWKRAFWVLVLHDRMASASLGRPCSSGEEDFDAELPLEVDDEYWETEDPEMAFRQPLGKPSKIAAFNSHLKLTKIAAYALRTMYALDRSKLLFRAARPRWQEILAQLNQSMLEWVDSVPKHLRWSPHIEDSLFSNQSATLYFTYYLIQILIYRPFCPPSLQSAMNITPHSNMPVPCIAICVNAGKCVARIFKAEMSRGYRNIPALILGSHVCAAILLMNFWDLKWQERNQLKCGAFEDIKSPLAPAMAELLECVSVFIEALETVKPRWRCAEMYLNDLGSSLPHSLGGFEPSVPKDDPLERHFPSRFDDRAYHDAAPPDYAILGDYRNPPPEYRLAPLVDTYTCDDQVEPSESSPHFFEYPHITRYPLPSALSFPPLSTSRQRDFRSQQDCDELSTEFGYRRPSTSSVHSRPDPLFGEKTMNQVSTTQPEPSFCRQYTMANHGPFRDAMSMPTHQSMANDINLDETRISRATDWDYANPPHAFGLSSDNTTGKLGFQSQDRETRNTHDEILAFPGRY